jgi:Winged helix-turn-helix DNA-binding
MMFLFQRAAEAIQANPLKSNRAIAEELGISEPTVRRARKSPASRDAPALGKRIGRDGKGYRLPGAVVGSGRDGPRETPACVEPVSPSLTPPEPSNAPVDSPDSLPAIEPVVAEPDVEADIDLRHRKDDLDLLRARLRGDCFD